MITVFARNLPFLRCALLVCAAGALASGTAADWPQWRGPNRDGISPETDLRKEWPAVGPPLVWKASGLGSGYSSLAVVGGKIFTIGDRDGSSFVVALDGSDGKQVWAAKLGKPGAPGWGGFSGPRGTPAVAGELVVALGQWGELVCIEAATGKERWRKDYDKDLGGDRPEWGFSESPLIDGHNLICTPGGKKGTLAALNKDTGAVVWRAKGWTDNAHYASPIVVEIDGVRQYVQLTAASVAGVAAADGTVLWRAARKGDTAVIPTPVYADNHVYVSSGYGVGCHLFKVSSHNGKFAAEQVYANKVMVNHHGGVVKIGDFVYGYSDSKGWTCQDFKTGAAKWQDKEKLGKGTLIAAGGYLYLRQEDKPDTIALIEASPEGYREHGRFKPPGRGENQNWAHLAIADGKLYVRDHDLLFCYNIKSQ